MSKNSQQQEWEDFVGRVRTAVEKSGGPSLVASRSGLARRTINAYLVGETDPSRERILALAEATDVRPEWLLTGQGPMRLEGVAEQSIPYRDSPPLDLARLAKALEYVETAVVRSDRKPTFAQKARVVAQVYLLLELPEPPGTWAPRITDFLEATLTIQ
jgi:transcriptional regulator with XRE-family HTH domain